MSAFKPDCTEPPLYGGGNRPVAIGGKGGQKVL